MAKINTKLIASLVFAIVLGIVSSLNLKCFAAQIEAKDLCIKVVVNDLKRTNSLQDDFNSSTKPSTGNDFLVLNFTITEIACGYVFPSRNMTTNTYVFDSESNSYSAKNMVAKGIQFEDSSSLASTTAFVEGSIVTMAFELPIEAIASSISLAYYYGSSWDDSDNPNSSQLNFSLIDTEIDGGYHIGSDLWLKVILQVTGSPVTLVWKEVGTDITPSGDKVVSGYFYADPNDFAYGSVYNPEIFVKIYIAKNGWCNIAFNHVTVDDVTVSSAHQYNGTAEMTGTVALNSRLVEHQYNNISLQ